MSPNEFIAELSSLNFPNTFNPYRDNCIIHDKENAAKTRSDLLLAIIIRANECELDSVWIGRDLGHRGGRRTGLALTDDANAEIHANRWGLSMERPTKGQPLSERTATVIWDMLAMIKEPIFLWNVFPLHPHKEGDPFSNRAHNAKERRAGEELLSELVKMLKPKRLIAVGNDAEKSLKKLSSSQSVLKVRHPSYGGQTQFISQIFDLYKVERTLLL